MAQFLSTKRREILIRYLCDLGMEYELACIHASYPADTRRIDRNLAGLARCIGKHAEAIREANKLGNVEYRNRHELPMKADLMILSAYHAEIIARGLPKALFAHTTRTIAEVLAEVRVIKAQMSGRVVSYTGALQ
jgi:hypothetical protein